MKMDLISLGILGMFVGGFMAHFAINQLLLKDLRKALGILSLGVIFIILSIASLFKLLWPIWPI